MANVLRLPLFRKALTAMGLLPTLLGLVGGDPQRITELEEGVATEADVRATSANLKKPKNQGIKLETTKNGKKRPKTASLGCQIGL